MLEFENKRLELIEKIEEFIRRKQYAALRDLLCLFEAADIAPLMDGLSEEDLPLLFRLLPKELAAAVFVELDSDVQELLIQGFSNTELKEVLDELYLDDAVDIVEEMPANVVKRILMHSDPDMRKSINEILKYPEDSAGSIMTTEFVDLKASMTVEDAFKRIRRTGPDKETINICYVIDDNRHLIGLVSLRTLLLTEEDAIIGDIMETNLVSVSTLDDQEYTARTLSKYDFLALPVVDTENRLVGIVTVDDAMDVLQEEVTEDIEKMAAILPSDKPYLKTDILEMFKSRIPWLLLLMISATFTGQIISRFENALAAATILTAYIPMLMDTGGNAGSQSAVTVIRGISLNEIVFRDILRVIWKEIRVSLLCGLTLASANFLKLIFIDQMLFHNPAVTPTVALVVCSTLVVTVFSAKVVGCSLPLLAKRAGFDPAVMASPIITTIVDAISLSIYFSFASAILHVGG
ncbi:MAG: magnesium transporter [Oscillibacter sp.]|uniref:magnesium transporter n=1 Tax=Oscillibacter sp. TaxID=1945593 RepID=UPI00289741DD|nr:magnesium transporter [Oscillibacter sp.]MEA4994041.1 magnesium transporter [Oscillibacter sp.]